MTATRKDICSKCSGLQNTNVAEKNTIRVHSVEWAKSYQSLWCVLSMLSTLPNVPLALQISFYFSSQILQNILPLLLNAPNVILHVHWHRYYGFSEIEPYTQLTTFPIVLQRSDTTLTFWENQQWRCLLHSSIFWKHLVRALFILS